MAVIGRLAVVLVALQDAAQQIQLRERVGEAPRELLLGLEAAAEHGDGEVGDKGEVARGAPQLAIPFGRAVGLLGHLAEEPKVTLWKNAPKAFESEKATWPQNAASNATSPPPRPRPGRPGSPCRDRGASATPLARR